MRGIALALLVTAGLAGAAGVERPKILGVAHISLFRARLRSVTRLLSRFPRF